MLAYLGWPSAVQRVLMLNHTRLSDSRGIHTWVSICAIGPVLNSDGGGRVAASSRDSAWPNLVKPVRHCGRRRIVRLTLCNDAIRGKPSELP